MSLAKTALLHEATDAELEAELERRKKPKYVTEIPEGYCLMDTRDLDSGETRLYDATGHAPTTWVHVLTEATEFMSGRFPIFVVARIPS